MEVKASGPLKEVLARKLDEYLSWSYSDGILSYKYFKDKVYRPYSSIPWERYHFTDHPLHHLYDIKWETRSLRDDEILGFITLSFDLIPEVTALLILDYDMNTIRNMLFDMKWFRGEDGTIHVRYNTSKDQSIGKYLPLSELEGANRVMDWMSGYIFGTELYAKSRDYNDRYVTLPTLVYNAFSREYHPYAKPRSKVIMEILDDVPFVYIAREIANFMDYRLPTDSKNHISCARLIVELWIRHLYRFNRKACKTHAVLVMIWYDINQGVDNTQLHDLLRDDETYLYDMFIKAIERIRSFKYIDSRLAGIKDDLRFASKLMDYTEECFE